MDYEAERNRVLELLRKYGVNSLAYLALEKDKTWFFPQGVEGVAAYAVSKREMLVCGDPICAKKDLPAFLTELKQFARRSHWRLVLLFTLESNREIYRAAGFGSYKGGEEAVFDLDSYTMAGGRAAKVRASVHQATRDGLTVSEYRPCESRDAETEKAFADITAGWLQNKHTSLLKFALGGLDLDFPNDKRYFYARDKEGTVQGFMVFNPFLGGQGYIVDIMRRRPGCSHGVMELIFHSAYEQMKAEGVRYGSLGIAPLANTADGEHSSLFERLEHYDYENMNGIYGFKPLYAAKDKYAPTRWNPVYITCLPAHITPFMGYAMVSTLDTRGFRDYVGAFRKYCMGRGARRS